MTAHGVPQGDEIGPEVDPASPSVEGPAPTISPVPTERRAAALAGSITSTRHLPGPGGLSYADVPNRAMALVIDLIVLAVTGFVLSAALGGLVSRPGALDEPGGQLDLAGFLIVLVLQLALSFAYFVYLWTAVRATAGMRLLGIQVGHESDGRAISLRQALPRWLLLGVPVVLTSMAVYVPDLIGLVLGGIGLAWLCLLLYTIARSHTDQGWHDRYARTIVVRARRRPTKP